MGTVPIYDVDGSWQVAIHIPAVQMSSLIGGDVCESNAPETFCVPHNGFEDRGTHQDPSAPIVV